MIKKISPQEVTSENALIIDVRTEMECAEKRLCRNHVHVPLDQLEAQDFKVRYKLEANSPLYILCRSGQRAMRAAEKFAEIGMTNVQVIDGGIIACEECGHQLEGHLTGKNQATACKVPLSLERQVRIAAGLFVLAGSLLGYFMNPAFIFIPAFVGAGLIFAGVTDRCGLMLVLTRMPWNKP
jgi:rhodanese-related sulfurtransferase